MPTSPSERNLLFAVLALQNELARSEDVLAAMHAWALAKHRPLGELLVERGALADDDRRLLDALIDRQLAKHGTVEQSLVALAPSSRTRGLLAQVADPDVQASLAVVATTSEPERTIDYKPESGERYRVLRPHAEGGLGEVFVAEDLELHREVALKRIKKEHAEQDDSRVRFVQEAEITGGLEHPGIVPVYGLGVYDDGRPFYAMRFIKGDNLKSAIEHFHASEPVRFDSLEFRQLLGRYVDVCQAVAYAHSRGVLHRDLKPGNIMLGKFGETLVVDWGLAKVIGRSGGDRRVSREEATLRPGSGSGWAETMAGSAVGTPGFMSPEQASGKLDELGPATDVYSLGATLYAVLANRPPFQGSAAEVLEQVRRGSWIPPRAVNGLVPAGLDAICRKAMALRPEDRYGSPLELAEEVEHWLADEPVSAYREPAAVRMRRWLRKRPKRVTAAAVLLLTTVVGLTIGTVLLDQSNRQIAAKEAEAVNSLQMAREAVDEYFTRVSEEVLLEEKGMRPLREKLLRSALNYYERFIKQRENDRSVRRELAEAYRRAADASGDAESGTTFSPKAVLLYEELLRKSPGDRDLRFGLARSDKRLAWSQWGNGEYVPALASANRGIMLLEQLRAEEPENGEVGRLLGEIYTWRALSEERIGNPQGHAADSERAVKVLRETLQLAPKEEATLRLLGTAYRRQHSLAASLLSVKVLRELVKSRDPPLASAQEELAQSLAAAGVGFIDVGQPAKAETFLQEAIDLLRELKWSDRSSIRRQGESLFLQGKTRRAGKLLGEAVSDEENSRQSAATTPPCNVGVDAWLTYVLGCLEAESGDPAKGLDHCTKALSVQEQSLARNKDQMTSSDSLWNREAIARFRFQLRQISRDKWITDQRKILEERKQVAGNEPNNGQFAGEVGASAAVLAGLLTDAGRAADALGVIDQALPNHVKAVETYPERRFELRAKWAELLARNGEALAKTGKGVDAGKAVRQAIEITEELSKQEHCYLYDLAHHLTLASTLPDGAGVANAADRAVKALGEYIASGFDNPYKLGTDPRLKPLQGRDDFKKLVRDLQAKVKEAKETR